MGKNKYDASAEDVLACAMAAYKVIPEDMRKKPIVKGFFKKLNRIMNRFDDDINIIFTKQLAEAYKKIIVDNYGD